MSNLNKFRMEWMIKWKVENDLVDQIWLGQIPQGHNNCN